MKMKKIILGLILISLSALFVLPVVAVGPSEPITTCTIRNSNTKDVTGCNTVACPATEGTSLKYEDCAICCLMDKVYQVTNWIFLILMALVVIFVLYGGFLILTAGGSEEKVTKGKTYITYALAGFVIAILARALPNIAYYFVK